MNDRSGESNILLCPVFGLICGLLLFAVEAAVSFLVDNQTFPHILVITALASSILGLLVGIFSYIVHKIFEYVLPSSSDKSRRNKPALTFIPVSVIFIQGWIIINYLFMYGVKVFNASSILIDCLWLVCCFTLLSFSTCLYQRKPGRLKTKLFIGLLLALSIVALLSMYYEKPYEISYTRVLMQIATLFAGCIACYVIAFFFTNLLTALFTRGGSKKYLPLKIFLFYGTCFLLLFFSYRFYTERPPPGIPAGGGSLSGNMPNIILIVLDTLRADHLSSYGYNRKTSRNLDEFSQTAVRFENCYSTANWTVPGHASIFTGKYSISHGAHKTIDESVNKSEARNPFFSFPLADEETTLAEILHENGYRTAAVVANHTCVSGIFGLDQGFDYFYNNPPFTYRPVMYTILGKLSLFHDHVGPYLSRFRIAGNINEKATRWINAHSAEPFFIFINYMDTHDPYFPPWEYQNKFPGRSEKFHADIHEFGENHESVSEEQRQHLISQYDGEIAYLDEKLGELFDWLKTNNLFDNSIIVLTSDHGEYLGEHQLYGHSVGLYEPVIKVPLIIHAPLQTTWGIDTSSPVQTIDIMPTTLELLGIPIPPWVQGEPLVRTIQHPIISEHYVGPNYKNTYRGRFYDRLISIIENEYKFIFSENTGYELYDIARDREELHNLIESDPERSISLLNGIEEWKSAVEVKALDQGAMPELNESTLRDLRALGYIH